MITIFVVLGVGGLFVGWVVGVLRTVGAERRREETAAQFLAQLEVEARAADVAAGQYLGPWRGRST